jgi:anti-anti-sigma factor
VLTGAEEPGDEFTVSATFVEDEAVLSLGGDLDLTVATKLGSLLDAIVASGYPSLVVDMAEVEQMTAGTLGVLVKAAARMASLNGRLAIRSPSSAVQRLLDLSGLHELTITEPREARADLLGTSQSTASTDPARSAVAALSHQLDASPVTGGTGTVAYEPVDGALRLLVALAGAALRGADGASVSLRRYGALSTVAATDQTIMDMDINQYETGEGPCVDASTEGLWFHAASLEAETRWPEFIPRARDLGINAILSTPLLAHDRPVGALNVYSRTVAAFAPEDQRLAAVLATEASAILTDSGMNPDSNHSSTRYQDALVARQIIAMAQGVAMERLGLSVDEAYSELRSHSMRTNQPLLRRAEDVIASTRRPGLRRGLGSERDGSE